MSASSTRPARRRRSRLLAGATAATVATGALAAGAAIGAGSAGAATPVVAQSVGRYLDGSAGGNPIQSLVDLKDARAAYPGTTSGQNPLDVTLFQQAHLPLTGALQLPQILGIDLGAATQRAVARASGYARGATATVANQGGASIGGQNSGPYAAKIDLTPSALGGANSPVPLPVGSGSAAPLGGVTATIGAVSSQVTTPAGVRRTATSHYSIANLHLSIGSPLLGQTLGQIADQLNSGLSTLAGSLGGGLPSGVGLPAACSLTTPDLTHVSLEGGAVVLDGSTATMTVDLGALLDRLGLRLNDLPPNTDLISYLTDYLANPNGLAQGLQSVVDGLVNPLNTKFQDCLTALQSEPGIGAVAGALNTAVGTLTQGQATLEKQLKSIIAQLSAQSGGSSAFKPLADGLKQLIDIGANVQQLGGRGTVDPGTFSSALHATPDQATPVVTGQFVERAIEIAVGGGQLDLALATSAAGPSDLLTAPTHAPRSPAPDHTPDTTVPTAVPAGQGPTGGGPALPLLLVGLGVLAAAGGLVARRASLGRHSA